MTLVNKNELAKLYPGDRTLTRRILKRCRESGIDVKHETEAVRIGGGRWGSRIVAYHVPQLIHDDEVVRREEELRRKQQDEAKRLAERRAAERLRRIDKLTEKFPQLMTNTIEDLADSGKSVYLPSDTGYQFGIGTKAYWKQLGFNVSDEPNGIVVKGNRLYGTYSSVQLVPRASRMTVRRLQAKWLAKYVDEQLVLAQAIRIANRLQKVKRHPSFYDLKDRWIRAHQDQLTEGRIARVEDRTCWGCDGTGGDDYSETSCDRCYGTGIYSSRTLYEHCFEISGQRFVFHSYVLPRAVSDERGEDIRNYGRPFAVDELPCPPQSVIVSLIESMMAKHD